MSAGAGVALGIGLGVFLGVPLIGAAAVLLADVITDWHWKREGLTPWVRRERP